MSDQKATRRRFFPGAGAAVAAPLAFAPRSSAEVDSRKALRQTVRKLEPEEFARHAQLRFNADRTQVSVRLQGIACFDELIDAPETLLEMAQAQGEGILQQRAHAMLVLHCTRSEAGWVLVDSSLEAIGPPAS